ncbi:MAG: Smr/MutS family protein [Pseudomonadota bacterium]
MKGKRTPDARLDLHGMSAARAHAALKMFISDSRDRGCRCVLVITGKGSDEPAAFGEVKPGVLRRETPRWLSSPPLAQMIVTVAQAHPKHGGSGALYVYLKRKR